jgi:hypothetical protein
VKSVVVDAQGNAVVTVTGGNESFILNYSGTFGSFAALSGGTITPNSGPTIYGTKTAEPMVIEFYGSPEPISSPTPISAALEPCVTIFLSSVFCSPLPANPAIAPNSTAWSALEFQPGHAGNLGNIDQGGSNEPSEPVSTLNVGDPTVAMTISCDTQTYSLGTCSRFGIPNGSVQLLPPGAYVETNADGHLSVESVPLGGEIDFWNITSAGKPIPSTPGILHLGGAGFCKWSSDGTNCSGSTATNIATPIGGIRGDALQAGEADPIHGTLGYAISVALLCGDPTWVYPATFSDGSNTNASSACVGHTGAGARPPEGTRGFLKLHDADINATSNLPYVKVILRTIDEDHYGTIATDTNWSGAPGISVAYGHGGFAFAAKEAGITSTTYQLPVTVNGIDLATQFAWCSNGTCASSVTPTPTPTATPAPAASPSPSPSPSPTPGSTTGYYPSSIFYVPLPSDPIAAEMSATWLANQSPSLFDEVTIDETATLDSYGDLQRGCVRQMKVTLYRDDSTDKERV